MKIKHFFQFLLCLLIANPLMGKEYHTDLLQPYVVYRLKDRKVLKPQEFIQDISQSQIIMIGERHENSAYQDAVWALLSSLSQSSISLSLAMELLDQKDDDSLKAWMTKYSSDFQLWAKTLRFSARGWKNPQSYFPIFQLADMAKIPVWGLDQEKPQISDQKLDHADLQSWLQSLDESHCHLKPQQELMPLAKMQTKRDQIMAQRIQSYINNVPNQPIITLTGLAHIRKDRGIPKYLAKDLKLITIALIPSEKKIENQDPLWQADYWLKINTPITSNPCDALRSK